MLSVCTQFSEVAVHAVVELHRESSDGPQEEEGVGRDLVMVEGEQEAAVEEEEETVQGLGQADDR